MANSDPQGNATAGAPSTLATTKEAVVNAWQGLQRHLPSGSFLWYAVSAGTPTGILLTLCSAIGLATLSFGLINALFEASCYSHLSPLHTIDSADEESVFREALNRRNRSDGQTLSTLRKELHIRVLAGALSSSAADSRSWNVLKSLVLEAGPIAAPLAEKTSNAENVCTVFWWSSATSKVSADAKPADAKVPVAETTSFPEFGYALEIRSRDSHGSLEVEALYFPVIAGKADLNFSRSYSVLKRTTVPLLWFEPCSVRHSEGELASRFAEEMKRSMRGNPTYQAMLLKNRDQREQVEIFIRSVLLRILGQPIPGEGDKVTEASEFQPIETIVSWPRRLNGSDAFGIIQYLTVAAFWGLTVIALAKYRIVGVQRAYLQNLELFPELGETIDFAVVDRQLGRVEQERQSHDQLARGLIPCAPLEVLHAGYAASKNSREGYDSVPSFVTSQSDVVANAFASAHWLMRYLIWLIPSVGFVGTVIGIGVALLGTGAVLSDDKFEQQSAIQSIAANLGTAFDTTFVALILAIAGMFFLHLVQRVEEELIQESTERVIGSLIDPDKVAPSAIDELLETMQALVSKGLTTGTPPTPRGARSVTAALRNSKRATLSRVHVVQTHRLKDVVVVACGTILALGTLIWVFPPERGSALRNLLDKAPGWMQPALPRNSDAQER